MAGIAQAFLLAALVMGPVAARATAGEAAWRGAGGRTVLLAEPRLAVLRSRLAQKAEPTWSAWLKLKADADANLGRQPHVSAEWYVPGYYSNAEGHTKTKAGLMDDANAAYGLALAYRMTGDERYAVAAVRLINAWATGVRTFSMKDDSTLSFSYHFPAMIFAAALVDRSLSWPGADKEVFRVFVRDKALPMNCMGRANNWGNWGLVLVMASAAYLQDQALFDKAVARWKEFIERQIAEDGRLPHEVNRNGGRSGLWYSHFSLMPQTLAAEIARVNRVDLYDYRSPSGRTLRLAFDRVADWARRPETFPYWKGDIEELHGRDYVSYFEVLNVRWPNADATALLAEGRPLSARHSAPALTFTHGGIGPDIDRPVGGAAAVK